MEEIELILKLNQDFNFHLSLRVIQISDDELLFKLKELLEQKGKSSLIISSLDDAYNLLKKAKESKIDYVLVNESVTCLLPLIIGLTKDIPFLIKPIIPVFYCLKDNKIIQHIKSTCNIKHVPYYAFKNKNDLLDEIVRRLLNEK